MDGLRVSFYFSLEGSLSWDQKPFSPKSGEVERGLEEDLGRFPSLSIEGRASGEREGPPEWTTSASVPASFYACAIYQLRSFQLENTHHPFSTDPGPVTDVFTNIVNTHDPTWQDCQQLMTSLLTTEERKRVLAAMKRQTEARRNAAVNLVDHMRETCPETDPQWDPNTAAQLARIRQYGQLMIQGLAEAGKKPTNLSKVKEIKQGADESPGAYLERLLSAYRQYTPFNPAEEANRNMVNATFVEQSAPDIRRKLQKLDGFAGMNMSQLIEIANRVMANRDQEEKRDKQRQMRAQAICLAAALREWNPGREQSRGRSRGRSYGPGRGQPLGQDQCSNCKQQGHWRRDCPQIRRGRGRGHPQEQRGRGSEVPGRQETLLSRSM
ncbi:uncharacterized protein [Anolis sagrei]|uniref:uncharacterized protein n=1 Tax=Anolis sagrei TaxID=38937 RepID=UPI003522B602